MATLCGNVTAVKLLLDAKADIKSARGIEFSLLYAVSEGSVELTKLYIAAGADVNTRRHDNYTCLHELVKQCLPSGEWARKEHSHEEYPIFADKFNATPFDYPGVFQVLIDAKADVSAQGSSNCETPLHVAAHLNNVQAVTALLAAGASPDDATGQDLSAIHMAANSGFLGVVTALIAAGADVNRVENDGGGSPVFIAAAGHDHSHLGIVSALIAAGADVNCVSHKGFTPVLIATAHGNPKIVSALIAARANVNYISHNPDHMFAEVSPLEIALGKNYNEIASILKAAGALTWECIMTRTNPLFMINGSNSNGDDVSLKYHLIGKVSATDKENALKLGVFMRNLILVKCMLAAGVNPSLPFRGRDLLCWASAWGHADIVKVLLDAGADITFKDHEGMTALQLAVRGKHLDVLVLLLTRAYELRKKK
jgi:ankyrin repeat protein